MPGPPFEILSNDSRQDCFSTATRSGTWSVATSDSDPSARPSHSASGLPAARSGGEITTFAASSGGGVVAVLGHREVVRAGLGEHRLARPRARAAPPRALGATRGGRRTAGASAARASAIARSVASASTYGGRDDAWNRGAVSPGGQVPRGQRLEDRPVLAVDLEHPAALAGRRQRPEQGRVVDPEVVDHERLERRHAGLDRRAGISASGVGLVGGDHEAQPDVDRGVGRRRGLPLAQPDGAATARPPATSPCPGC